MARIDNLTNYLTDVAQAIKNKKGDQTPIQASQFDTEIANLPSGGGGGKEDELIERTLSSYTNSTASIIGKYAFYCLSSLEEVAFSICDTIDTYAFYSCSNLKSVSFPQCSAIYTSAFDKCKSLTTISFPECKNILSYAFNNCSSLSIAVFPKCNNISQSAFLVCDNLTTVSFPQCSRIYPSAFRNCINLLSVYLLGDSVPNLSNINAFQSTPISNYTTSTGGVYGSIIVQPSMLDAFKTTTNWSVYSSRFSAWNGVD